jgi:ADP-ribosyl-[dinitrogen reductase] hydrolase
MHGGVDEVPLPEVRGRLWLAGKHFVGPDAEAAIASVGATAIVCLNEAAELRDRYPDYVAWLVANQPDRAIWHPVPDLHAPTLEAALELLAELRRRVGDGEGLLVHCGAGIGRAGTVAAGLLVVLGTPVDDALRTVAHHRPTAGPEAGEQSRLLAAIAASVSR